MNPETRTKRSLLQPAVVLAFIVVLSFLTSNSRPASAEIATAVSAGGLHTCGLTAEGGLKCWGRNVVGQLGNGAISFSATPTPVDVLEAPGGAPLSSVATPAAGLEQTCALTTTAGLKCWGRNGLGTLGDGTTTNRTTPVDVTGLTSGMLSVAPALDHTCALTAGGGVKCWGSTTFGKLGIGPTSDIRTTPVDVLESPGGVPLSGVVAVAVGRFHTCALTAAKGVKCWGLNSEGQLGDGSKTVRSTPVDVLDAPGGSPLGNVVAIATLGFHTCAVTTAASVMCWGRNNNGQLGDGTLTNRTTPVDVLESPGGAPLSGVVAVAVGFEHTCSLTTAGGVMCWGRNDNGQLGDGTRTNRSTPVDVAGLSIGAAAISTGTIHSCALTTAGGIKCWGNNSPGQLGDGTTTNRLTPVRVQGFGPVALLDDLIDDVMALNLNEGIEK